MCRRKNSRSVEPMAKMITTQLKKAAPTAVRTGRSRGRSSRSCWRWSPVNLLSSAGQAYMTPNTTSGNSAPPKNGLGMTVRPPITSSQLGAVLRQVRVVRAPLPDGIDLDEAAHQKQHGGHGEHEAQGPQRVRRPHRRPHDIALAPARPGELGMVL